MTFGASSTGDTVATGVQFDGGVCVLRWRGEHPSTAIYASWADLALVHHVGQRDSDAVRRVLGELAGATQPHFHPGRRRLGRHPNRGKARAMTRPINLARACDVLGQPKATREPVHPEAKVVKEPASGMNKTEARFKREVIDQMALGSSPALWAFASIKLQLAKRTWYTPDFFVWVDYGSCVVTRVYEVKGSWKAPHQEDSRVKLKVAAELYPQFTFYSAVPNRETGGWHIEEIPCRQRQ